MCPPGNKRAPPAPGAPLQLDLTGLPCKPDTSQQDLQGGRQGGPPQAHLCPHCQGPSFTGDPAGLRDAQPCPPLWLSSNHQENMTGFKTITPPSSWVSLQWTQGWAPEPRLGVTSMQDNLVLALPKASVLGPPTCARDLRVSLANGKTEQRVFFLLPLSERQREGWRCRDAQRTVLLMARSRNDTLSCWVGSPCLSRSLPMTRWRGGDIQRGG